MFYDVAKTKEDNAQRNLETVHNTNVLRYIQQGFTLSIAILSLVALVRSQTK